MVRNVWVRKGYGTNCLEALLYNGEILKTYMLPYSNSCNICSDRYRAVCYRMCTRGQVSCVRRRRQSRRSVPMKVGRPAAPQSLSLATTSSTGCKLCSVACSSGARYLTLLVALYAAVCSRISNPRCAGQFV